MIAILYGGPFAPFVESIIRDLRTAGADLGVDFQPLSVERAAEQPAHCARIERLYVLPFDVPGDGIRPSAFVRRLFPRAEIVNPVETHELCWDKLTTAERLLNRGIPLPESLYTNDPDEVCEFVARNQFAILKERRSCGGHGHVVLCDSDEVLVGEANGHRFVVELQDTTSERRLREGVLTYPAPFYVQKLIGESVQGRFRPGQVLRAYLVDGQIVFWTERYRPRYLRPSDWIINVGLGARYRFVLETSEEIRKVAQRTAEVLGVRVGAIDLIRTGSTGPYVLEADTDGCHMYIDRQFKQMPEYRDPFDFDRFIAAALAGDEPSHPPRAHDVV